MIHSFTVEVVKRLNEDHSQRIGSEATTGLERTLIRKLAGAFVFP